MSELNFERLFEPVAAALNEEAARKILEIKADRKSQARVAKLAKKCNEGELTPEERREYESYVYASRVVSLLRAEALVLLARRARAK